MPRTLWLPALLLALLWLLPMGAHNLFDPDEGRYAEIPRVMVATGDWVTPRLDGLKYFEKPALQYWATAISYEVLGVNEWSARLFSALCALASVALTFWMGLRLYGARAAGYAALVLFGSVLFAGVGRLVTLDMPLSFGLQLCLSGLLLLVLPAPALRDQRVGATLLALGLVVALLAKGLVGLLIPLTVAGMYWLLWRDWSLLWRARPWWSLLALALLAAPWFVVVSLRNPEFAHFFFIHEHFERYLTTEHHRYEPDWFFIPVLLGGFLPFTTLLPGALAGGWRAARGGSRPATLLLLWAGFILLFFSLSQSKLVPYVLPLWPALALLCGRHLEQLAPAGLARHLLVVLVLAALLLAALLGISLLPAGAPLVAKAGSGAVRWILIAAVGLAAGLAAAWWLARRSLGVAAVACAAVASSLFIQGLLQGGEKLPGRAGIPEMARAVAPYLQADTPVYCVEDYLQTVNFYLRRNCSLVRYRGELDFGLNLQPSAWLPDTRTFADEWRKGGQALALMPPDSYARLTKQQLPMRVIYTSPIVVAVLRQ
ncbi:MAG: glycosyltransferase family 39 protein [Steroidobacteraceae bacterium]